MRRGFVAVTLGLCFAAPALLAALKLGWVSADPKWLAGLMAGLTLALTLELGWVLARRGALGWGAAVGRVLLLAGAIAALGVGTANWALGLQGYVIAMEREPVTLGAGGQLEALEAGPLARLAELEARLAVEEVELTAAPGGFVPLTRLQVQLGDGAPERITLGPGRVGVLGALRLRQGAFGFAPRLVVLKDGRTELDRVVPFTTARQGGEGTAFTGALEIASAGLSIAGEIDLGTLDAAMRGHPTLRLDVRKGDVALGRGVLRPGEFADLEQGYRVGFAGLRKWVEIDVSRRNYVEPMLAGAAVAALGALVWGGAAVAARRRA